jgi:hypothetical protein
MCKLPTSLAPIVAAALLLGFLAPRSAIAADAGLTPDDIVRMTTAGLSDDIIVGQIKKNGKPFDLTTDQLVALKTAKVSDRVIQVMLDPTKADGPVAAAPVAVPVAAAVAASATPPAAVAPTAPSAIVPTAPGMYVKRNDEWVLMQPETFAWKKTGGIKKYASVGIIKRNVDGELVGPNSRNSITKPADFLIVTPQGASAEGYQLLKLRQNEKRRAFRTVTGSAFHAKESAEEDLVQFGASQIGPNQFSITLGSSTDAGEYGFLPPHELDSYESATSGKMYTFRLLP